MTAKKEFELNLLALASILIKSDGEVSKQELQFVRNYFISIYGQYRGGGGGGGGGNYIKGA